MTSHVIHSLFGDMLFSRGGVASSMCLYCVWLLVCIYGSRCPFMLRAVCALYECAVCGLCGSACRVVLRAVLVLRVCVCKHV